MQLTVRAVDGGLPARTSTVEVPVLVNVVRNVNGPVFVNSAVSREVSQTAQVGDTIAQVNAVDADGVVRCFDLHLFCYSAVCVNADFEIALCVLVL